MNIVFNAEEKGYFCQGVMVGHADYGLLDGTGASTELLNNYWQFGFLKDLLAPPFLVTAEQVFTA